MPGFEIDERKLKSAFPPPDGEWYEGFKWLGAIGACAVLLIGGAVLVVVGVLRALL